MKSIGIVRKVDSLDRIVLPKELCRVMGIEQKTPMEIYTEGDKIILKKYEPSCIFCNTITTEQHKGKNICPKCKAELGRLNS
jgi:transcriptional pleiotropic regulator of transition state genes